MYWPFHFSPTVGYAVGGAVLALATIQNTVKLIKGDDKKVEEARAIS